MTKRYLSVFLVLIMAFGVFASGCAGKDIDQGGTSAPETTVSDNPAGDTPTVDNPDTPDTPDVTTGDNTGDNTVDPSNPVASFTGFGDVISDNQLEYFISQIKDPRYETVIRQILEGIQNFMPVIYVDPIIEADEALEFAAQILPVICVEYCYVESIKGAAYSEGENEGKLQLVKVNYYGETVEECINMVDELRTKTDSVLSKVESSWSDYQKVKYVHDWIVLNSTPDPDNVGGTWASNAYGAIVDGRPTCLGYAKATFYMLSKLGFDVVFDIGMGTTAKHIWVKVDIDGDWYCLDTTWDDPVSSTQVDPDYISYEYFLRTDEFMSDTHTDNFDMMFFNEPSATATELNWYAQNGCYIESTDDAEDILNQAIKDAVAGGKEYEYVRIFCSDVDVYDEVLSDYGTNGFGELLAAQTSEYTLDSAWGGTKKDFPSIHSKCITYRIKK